MPITSTLGGQPPANTGSPDGGMVRVVSKTQGGFPVTSDGRYFVVRGRLWRMSNPHLAVGVKVTLVKDLMLARRDISNARRTNDVALEADARSRVQKAKVSLGERGPVWWDQRDGDHNQRLIKNTPYAIWFTALPASR